MCILIKVKINGWLMDFVVFMYMKFWFFVILIMFGWVRYFNVIGFDFKGCLGEVLWLEFWVYGWILGVCFDVVMGVILELKV